MGSFIVGFHVRTTDRSRLIACLNTIESIGAWVFPPKNGWISFVERQASHQIEARITELARRTSGDLKTVTTAFLVHDSDFVRYWLYDDGELMDQFHSRPEYFGDDVADTDDLELYAGRPEILSGYCLPEVSLAQVRAALANEPLFADEQLVQIAELMGINPLVATINYGDLGVDISPAEIKEIGAIHVGEQSADDANDSPAAPFYPPSNRRESFADAWSQESTNDPGSSDPRAVALVAAAAAGDIEAVEQLVAEGADVNGSAALPTSSTGTRSAFTLPFNPAVPLQPLLAAASMNQTKAAERLLRLGAHVGVFHPFLGTALHVAAGKGAADLVRLLLAAGADPQAKNGVGQTPLEWAAQFALAAEQMEQSRPLLAQMPLAQREQLEAMFPAQASLQECERLLRAALDR